MSEDTTLADLLSLNLHNFEDEVHNIVDKAIKEMAMERMLKELEVVWSNMEFMHELHARYLSGMESRFWKWRGLY